MKTWKKLIALFSAAAMMCMILAGCASGTSDTSDTDDDTAATATDDSGTDWPTKSINMIVPMGAGGDHGLQRPYLCKVSGGCAG